MCQTDAGRYPFRSPARDMVDQLEARADAAIAAAEHGMCEFCESADLYADTSTDCFVGMFDSQSYSYHPVVCKDCQKVQTWWPEEVQNPP